MSILIKGIDLPKEGEHQRMIIHHNGSITIDKRTYYEEVQAIQIPTPHGRLIDADEMQGKAYERYFDNTISPYGIYEVNRAIENAPTILEAEEVFEYDVA